MLEPSSWPKTGSLAVELSLSLVDGEIVAIQRQHEYSQRRGIRRPGQPALRGVVGRERPVTVA